MEAPQGDFGELVCEFLEVCIHQLLCIREVYPPEIFERRRHFNVPVQWARHPELREYIHSAVTNLQPWIQQGVVEKIAVVFLDVHQVPVEKVIFKLCLKQATGAGLPSSHLEFALRGFLLKLCVSDSALSLLPPDCSWEVVAYMKTLAADISSKGQYWIPAEEKENSNQSFTITAIKSMRSSCLDMQLYIEHPVPVEEPLKREKKCKRAFYFSEHRDHVHSKFRLLASMEGVRISDRGELGELVCEFLEVCIHQLLCIRELYPPELFERRRHFNVPVQWARHPGLREYIHSAVTNLHTWIQQEVVDKITLLVVDTNQTPVEKFVFKLGLKQLSSAGVPAQHLEFALRGFLLKISVSDALMSPLPSDCSWELVAYLKSPSPDTISKDRLWIPADDEGWDQSFTITSIKSFQSTCLDMQLHVEHPTNQRSSDTEQDDMFNSIA